MSAPVVAYGEVRGFLEAFARLNDRTNFACTFTFEALPDSGSLEGSLRASFGDVLVDCRATPVRDWRAEVRAVLDRWLFQYRNPGEEHLPDPGNSFYLSDGHARGELIDWVTDAIGRAARPTAAWRVDVVTECFYECTWDDLVFESADRSYLLHLGASD
jgi:hypothetical protein